MAEATRQEPIYKLRIDNAEALLKFEQLNKQLQNVRANRTELNKAVRENIKAEKELSEAIKSSGSATEEETKELNRLRARREELNREQSAAIIIERDLASQTRELGNDLSRLTERGERFRDKLAQAMKEALNGSNIFQQFGNRAEFLRSELEDSNTALERQRQRIEEARKSFEEGALAEQEYAQAIEEANREITDQEAKQGQLQTELAQTEQKSEELKVQVQALTTAYQKGEITQEEFRVSLRKLEQDANQAKGAFNVDDWFNQFASSQAGELKSNLQSLALQYIGIGAAVEGARRIIGSAIDTVVEFDKALARIRALGQEYAGSIDAISEAARTAGTAFGFTATESVGAIEALAKAGLSVTDILGGALQGALTLAAAGNLNVGEAAEIAANTMTQFGLAGQDVTRIADLLAAGANKATGDVGDFAQALKQSGQVAAQFGVPVEEAVGTLTAFASAGLLGSDAGTSFRTMLLRLAKPSQEAADTMERLGIATFDAEGNFVGIEELAGQLQERLADLSEEQRNAALATIFGSDAIRAASILYEQGAQGIADWTEQVNQTGFAAGVAAEQQQTLQGALGRASAAWESFVLSIDNGSGKISAAIKVVVDTFTGFLQLLTPDRAEVFAEGVEKQLDRIGTKTAELIDLDNDYAEAQIRLASERIRGLNAIGDADRKQQNALARRAKVEAEIAKLEANKNNLTAQGVINLAVYREELEALNKVIQIGAAQRKKETQDIQTNATVQAGAIETVAQKRESLNAQIAAEKTAREQLAATDTQGLAAADARIAKLERELDLLEGKREKVVQLTEAEREMQAVAAQPVEPIQPISPEQQLEQASPLQPATPLTQTDEERARQEELFALYEEERIAFQELQDAKIMALGGFANALSGLVDQSSDAAKVLLAIEKASAIANIIVNLQRETQLNNANPAWSLLPDGGLAIKTAANTVARIRAAVAIATIGAQAIRGFAQGGDISGDVDSSWGPRVSRSNGDNVLVRAGQGYVTLKTGEKVLNERQQRMLELMAGRNVWGAIGLPGYNSTGGYATGGSVRRTVRGTALVNTPTAPDIPGGVVMRAVVDAERSAEIMAMAERPIVASWAEGMKVGDRIQLRESIASA